MIKLKPILEIQLIKEALPIEMARKYVSIDRNPHIEQQMDVILSAFKQLPGAKSSRRMDRVGVPYETKEFSIDISSLSDRYQEFWYEMRDIILHSDRIEKKPDRTTPMPEWEDLLAGTVPDEYGRKTKVSKWITGLITKIKIQHKLKELEKYIQKDERGRETLMGERPMEDVRKQLKDEARESIEDLIAKYNSIPEIKLYRENKTKSFYIVFSKHKYDVAGMSSGRGWTSCMNVYDGINKRYVQYDVSEGTMVAYLVRNDDLNIERPIARIAIKPFVNISDPNIVFYQAEQRAYGTPPIGFLDEVNRLIDEVQPGKEGLFRLADTLYCDTGDRTITKFSDPQLAQKVDALLKQERLAQTVDEVKYILTKYTYNLNLQDLDSLQFNESDKLYVNDPTLPVTYKGITYSPIAFQTIASFDISNTKNTFANFPQQCEKLSVSNMGFDSCETLDTIVTKGLYMDYCIIGGFNGLKPGPKALTLMRCNVKSFAGLPSTINNIEATSGCKMNMTVAELINSLKSVNATTVDLGSYVSAEYIHHTADKGEELALDIQRLMQEKDPSLADKWNKPQFLNWNSMNKIYKQVLLDIMAQLPTIREFSGYTKSDLKSPTEEYEEY